jgi:hypothetical protein
MHAPADETRAGERRRVHGRPDAFTSASHGSALYAGTLNQASCLSELTPTWIENDLIQHRHGRKKERQMPVTFIARPGRLDVEGLRDGRLRLIIIRPLDAEAVSPIRVQLNDERWSRSRTRSPIGWG